MPKNQKKIYQLALDARDIEIVWLYGSRAKGMQTDSSDYDLAIALTEHPAKNSLDEYYPDKLSSHWTEIIGKKISIIDINQIPVPLAYNVITDGKLILCLNDLRLHSEQQRIWSLWESYKYEHRRFRK
ncbi:MAG: hypothetical protein COA74_00290 [Gammaproteobacteria bacterium]|nr:MAG: hypothetical protein COA74_00290 [Gammaproteobacteria bacterium]